MVAACSLITNASDFQWGHPEELTKVTYVAFEVFQGSGAVIDAVAGPVEWVGNESFVVLFQRFEFYHTQFYWGAEIPEDYRARPDE